MSEEGLKGIDISIGFQRLNYKTKKYVENFKCKNSAIDFYFNHQALDDNSVVTYLFIDENNDKTISCVSLACSRIDVFNQKQRVKEAIPAFEIKYFASNEDYHSMPYEEGDSHSLSEVIMMKIITHIFNKCRNVVGGTHIVLYSVPEAVHFYEKCGFEHFNEFMTRSDAYFTKDCIPMYMCLLPEI